MRSTEGKEGVDCSVQLFVQCKKRPRKGGNVIDTAEERGSRKETQRDEGIGGGGCEQCVRECYLQQKASGLCLPYFPSFLFSDNTNHPHLFLLCFSLAEQRLSQLVIVPPDCVTACHNGCSTFQRVLIRRWN